MGYCGTAESSLLAVRVACGDSPIVRGGYIQVVYIQSHRPDTDWQLSGAIVWNARQQRTNSEPAVNEITRGETVPV